MRSRRTTLVAAVLAGLVVAAAAVALWPRSDSTRPSTTPAPDRGSAPSFAARFAKYKAAPEPNGDVSKVVWPKFVIEAGPEVKRLYEFQIRNGDLMRYMPCYCGCGQNAGHRSNRDCYVRRVNPDGSVVLDAMAPT